MNIHYDTTWQAMKPAKKVIKKRSGLNGHALPVCGKVRYRSREQAQDAPKVAKHARAAAEALGQPTNRREQRAYRCESGWHLTARASWIEAVA